MSRVLAIDYGTSRVGIAVSDEAGEHSFPRPAVANTGRAAVIAALRDLIQQEGAATIVVGLPLTMRGERGPQAASVERFAAELGRAVAVRVVFEDERLTTALASRFRGATADADSVAAAAILETYLERTRRSA